MYRLTLEVIKPTSHQIKIDTKDPCELVQQIIYHSDEDLNLSTLTLFIKPELWDIVSLKKLYDSTLNYLNQHINPLFALHIIQMNFDMAQKTLYFESEHPQIIHQLIQALQLKKLVPTRLLRQLHLLVFEPSDALNEIEAVPQSPGGVSQDSEEVSPTSTEYFVNLSVLPNFSP